MKLKQKILFSIIFLFSSMGFFSSTYGLGKIFDTTASQASCEDYSYENLDGQIECITKLECLEKGKITYNIGQFSICGDCPKETHMIQDNKCVPRQDIFTEEEMMVGFFDELSIIDKDQLTVEFNPISGIQKPEKLEITLRIKTKLAKILKKYLTTKKEKKIQIGQEIKTLPSNYIKEEIEKQMPTIISKFIQVMLGFQANPDKEQKRDNSEIKSIIISELLKNNPFFNYIKESILGSIPTIPSTLPLSSFNPITHKLFDYIFLKEKDFFIIFEQSKLKLVSKPEIYTTKDMIPYLEKLITKDKFKIEFPKTWEGQEVTFKISYFTEKLDQNSKSLSSCKSNEYLDNNNKCVTAQVCESQKKAIAYTIGKGDLAKQICSCPLKTHKIENGLCIKQKSIKENKENKENDDNKFSKILKSFFGDLMKVHDNTDNLYFSLRKAKNSIKEKIILKITDQYYQNYADILNKYARKYYEEGNTKKITLDNGTIVTVPYNYTSFEVARYVNEKLPIFLEGILDNDQKTMDFINKYPLLKKIVDRFFPKLPDIDPIELDYNATFNPKIHNLWQYIYLNEVKSFKGSNGIDIIKPSSYTKAKMTPYLKKLLKETNKWKMYSIIHGLAYITENIADCKSNTYYYDGKCIDKKTCDAKRPKEAVYPINNKCAACPDGYTGTHKVTMNGQCVKKVDSCQVNFYYQEECISHQQCSEKGRVSYQLANGNKICDTTCPDGPTGTHKVNMDGRCVIKVDKCTGDNSFFYQNECITKDQCDTKRGNGENVYPINNKCASIIEDSVEKKLSSLTEDEITISFEEILDSNPLMLAIKFNSNEKLSALLNQIIEKYKKLYESNQLKKGKKIIPIDQKEFVKQMIKEKIIQFSKKVLNNDSDTMNLVNKIPVLRKVVDKVFGDGSLPNIAFPDFDSKTKFDPDTHNLWQYIYLQEDKTIDFKATKSMKSIKKPDTYTKIEMKDYLNKLFKIVNRVPRKIEYDYLIEREEIYRQSWPLQLLRIDTKISITIFYRQGTGCHSDKVFYKNKCVSESKWLQETINIRNSFGGI